MNDRSSLKAASYVGLFCLLASGCASMDRISTKLDMASEHMMPQKPFYEGQLRAVRAVGAMTSLQFMDGKIFEVRTAPPGLVPGDIVRLYKAETEYTAHLWRDAESIPSPEANEI